MRLIAVGDIHGEINKLNKLLKKLDIKSDDTLVFLGDYIDRGKYNEIEKLKSCYETALTLAKENGIKTIAFPAISCGVYHFPLEEACQIATDTVKEFIVNNNCFEKVIFIDINDAIVEIYKKVLN